MVVGHWDLAGFALYLNLSSLAISNDNSIHFNMGKNKISCNNLSYKIRSNKV